MQYRMHPHIRDFPSRMFYNGELTDGFEDEQLLEEDLTRLSKERHRTVFFDL